MASIIPSLLFLSLLSHSLLLGKCNEDDDLLKGIQQYRINLTLTPLVTTTVADCIANEIADLYQNQSCTNATTFNATAFNVTTFPSYPTIMSKCVVNATNASGNSQILPTCVPSKQNLVVSDFTSKYATYLNSTGYSIIGVGSEDDWLVVLLTNIIGISPNGASGLTLAGIGPVVLSLLCLFMLV